MNNVGTNRWPTSAINKVGTMSAPSTRLGHHDGWDNVCSINAFLYLRRADWYSALDKTCSACFTSRCVMPSAPIDLANWERLCACWRGATAGDRPRRGGDVGTGGRTRLLFTADVYADTVTSSWWDGSCKCNRCVTASYGVARYGVLSACGTRWIGDGLRAWWAVDTWSVSSSKT
jgi:hypothetical protein